MKSTALKLESRSSAAPAGRLRVLVADDSRVIRQAVRKILSVDFDVVQAENGVDAWEQVQRDTEIKALVTDIEMPGLDGYELTCRIRGTDNLRLRDLPIIAITGADDEATRQRALACGATDFIVKPIEATQLLARVRAYTRYDQSLRELTEKTAVLEELAVSDPVTGLRSRRYIMERGAQDLAFSVRRERDLTLIRIEIDGFKKIYQTHGDEFSERLLVWLAKILLASARTEDAVARISGAEFAILANFTEIETASVLCERVRKAVAAQPFSDNGVTLAVTLSIGLASLGQDGRDNIEALLKLTQQRLCHAQSEGGNRACTVIAGETPHTVEEVSMLPVESSSVPASAPIDPVEELSVAELEDMIKNEMKSVDVPAVAVKVEPQRVVPAPTVVARAPLAVVETVPTLELGEPELTLEMPTLAESQQLTVDQALRLIAQNKSEEVVPHLERLIKEIQPLLDLHHRLIDTDVIG